jgi:predicted nucleotidyltransferase
MGGYNMNNDEFSTISIDISKETAEGIIRMFLDESNFDSASKYQFEAALAEAEKTDDVNPLAQAIYEAVLNEMVLKALVEETNKKGKIE